MMVAGLVLAVAGGIGLVAPRGRTVEAASTAVDCAPVTGASVDRAPLRSYTPITPVRLVDTRDGTGGASGPVGAGCTLTIALDESDVPVEAEAVALSVTAVAPQRGFLTVFACEEGRPQTSNLNTRPGIPTPNLVIAAVGSDRRICVFSSEPSDVIVDLAGWWSDGPDRFGAIEPQRAYDTREQQGSARVPAGEVRAIRLGGVHVPDGATAAVVNLTVTDSVDAGYLVAFPCGADAPLASNLNFVAGEARAVAAIVGLGPEGDLCVKANVDVHVIIDVSGSYGPAPSFGPAAALETLVGHRVVDTRSSGSVWNTPFRAGELRRIDPLAGTEWAGAAASVVLNVVATEVSIPGWVALFPCDDEIPFVSSLNFVAGGETTNLVTVELSHAGEVCVLASQPTDLVIDLFGVMAPEDGSLAERMSFVDRTVFPEFTPGGSDYAVLCDVGATALTLRLDVLPHVTVRVNGLATEPGDLDLVVPEEDLVDVELRRGQDELARYHFRCVPPDFPHLQIDRPGDPAPGWYLTTFGMGASQSGSFTVILDERGAPVWFKRTDVDVIDFKRLSSGRLVYTPLLGQTYGIDPARGYRVTDLFGRLIAEHFTDDPVQNPVDHHDYVELANGARALLTYPLLHDQDLTVLGDLYYADECVVDGVIQELDSSGTAVWEWSARNDFGYEEVTFPQRFGLYTCGSHGGEVDPFHLNSLAVVEDGSGDYIVSARHLDAVIRVDRSAPHGGVEWILGGSTAVPRPERLTIVGDPLGGPLRPHDARLVGDVLTLFDNRSGTSGPARAVAYEIDPNAGTATMLWEIRDPAGRPSGGLGSVRVAPDGSVLIAWGGLQPMFEELAPDGTRLMAIGDVANHLSYRIVKYPPSAFNAAVLRATAGGTAEPPPA